MVSIETLGKLARQTTIAAPRSCRALSFLTRCTRIVERKRIFCNAERETEFPVLQSGRGGGEALNAGRRVRIFRREAERERQKRKERFEEGQDSGQEFQFSDNKV